MLDRRRALGALAALCASALVANRAVASLQRAIPLADLVRASELVVSATPLDFESRWETQGERRRIVTTWRVRVDTRLDGDAADAEVLVQTLGGTVGKIGQIVDGEASLSRGVPCVLFLGRETSAARPVVGMAQGHYPLARRSDGASVLGKSPRLAELRGSGAVHELPGRTLEQARARVLEERTRDR